MKLKTLFSALLVSVVAVSAAARPSATPADFDATVARWMERFNVPGVAVAIIEDDRVVMLKGYGVRELGRPEPVTPHSVFGLASLTKTFTATSIAMLVSEGRLSWDDHVVALLPGFRLADPYVTAELTLRDLLAHRSGIQDDDDWLDDSVTTTAEAMGRMPFAGQKFPFRDRFGYQNTNFAILGEVVRAVTGQDVGEFVRARLYGPLGFSDLQTRVGDFVERADITQAHEGEAPGRIGHAALKPGAPDVASPHVMWSRFVLENPASRHRVERIPFEAENGVGPFHESWCYGATGFFGSAHDLANYLILQMGMGKYKGRQLIATDVMAQMHSLNSKSPLKGYVAVPDMLTSEGYGLGWGVLRAAGRPFTAHMGGILGYSSWVGFLPQEKRGFVILANNRLYENSVTSLGRVLLAYWLEQPVADPIAEAGVAALKLVDSLAAQDAAETASRKGELRPAHLLADYVGSYTDPLAGRVTVTEKNGALVLSAGASRTAQLAPWSAESFAVRWNGPRKARRFLTFLSEPNGAVTRIQIDGGPLFVCEPAKR